MIELIIFDYDDTLVKSSDALYEADFKTAKELGLFPASKEKYFSLWGKHHKDMIAIMYPNVNFENYIGTYKKLYKQDNLILFEGVKELLKKLKKDYKLAILSSKQVDFIKSNIKQNKIDFFDYIHGAESSEYTKPDPRILDSILEHFKIEPRKVLYVGDQIRDYVASEKAGLNFIAVTSGINTKEDFEKEGCKNIVSDIREILPYINHL